MVAALHRSRIWVHLNQLLIVVWADLEAMELVAAAVRYSPSVREKEQ